MATSENGYPKSDSNPVPAAPKVGKRLTEKGDEKTYPQNGQMVAIHYIGYLAKTGDKFDSSLERKQPLVFQLGAGGIIRGFEEGVKGMSLGERSFVRIPADLGYGSRGSGDVVPPGADLIFDMKLMSIQDPPTEEESTKFHNSPAGGSLELLTYFMKVQRTEGGVLDLSVFEKLLPEADIGASASTSNVKSTTSLHIASLLADEHDPKLIQTVINKLVDAGADLDATDSWGETPLTTVLCMLEEEEREEDEDNPCPPDSKLLAALVCYLEFDQQPVKDEDAARVLHQVGRISDQRSAKQLDLWVVGESITELLAKRIPKARLEELRQGGKLIDYLCTFYDTFAGADPKVVHSLLDARADPAVVQAHSGSNAFHFIALNAYGTYDGVFEVFKMLLERNSEAATAKDKTGCTTFWTAADYKDTAKQFECKPNPCAMLALGELLPHYDVDAGLVCLRVDEESRAPCMPPVQSKLRFMEGDRVKCLAKSPGANTWEEGVVVSLGYREESWPEGHFAAYEVKLDIGSQVFVISDTEKLIRAEHEKAKIVSKGKRFVKQPTADGWELLDTKTGKVRPSSPPDSDGD